MEFELPIDLGWWVRILDSSLGLIYYDFIWITILYNIIKFVKTIYIS